MRKAKITCMIIKREKDVVTVKAKVIMQQASRYIDSFTLLIYRALLLGKKIIGKKEFH